MALLSLATSQEVAVWKELPASYCGRVNGTDVPIKISITVTEYSPLDGSGKADIRGDVYGFALECPSSTFQLHMQNGVGSVVIDDRPDGSESCVSEQFQNFEQDAKELEVTFIKEDDIMNISTSLTSTKLRSGCNVTTATASKEMWRRLQAQDIVI